MQPLANHVGFGVVRCRVTEGRPSAPLRRWASLSLALVLVASVAREASADGWKVQLQGVKALGISYAGRATLSDASTVWFSPAGMTRLDRPWTITVGVPTIRYRLDYRDEGSRNLLGQPLTGPPSRNGGKTQAALYAYGVRKVHDRWRLGLGFNAPYGLESNYDETWVGRYHATKSKLTVLNYSATVAWKMSGSLSVAFGGDVQQSNAHLANMIDFGSIGAASGLPLLPQQHDGKIEFDAEDVSFGGNVSMEWEVRQNVRIAALYRSQINHTVRGPVRFTVPPAATPLSAGGALFGDTTGEAELPMPHELSTSAAVDVAVGWTLVGDVTWTKWSAFQQLVLTFDNPSQPTQAQDASFRDSARLAGGLQVRPGLHNGRWEFRGGGLYERSPVPDATRTPRLPESNNAGVSGGASVRFGERADLDFSYSYLFPHDSPIRLTSPVAGSLNGQVRWSLHIYGVSFNLKL